MKIYKLQKRVLIIVLAIALTACNTTTESKPKSQQDIALNIIESYAANSSNPEPTIRDYINAGVKGVNSDNIELINQKINSLDREDVDSVEEIDAIVNSINSTKADTTPPVITLKGSNPVEVLQYQEYLDAGATAIDELDGLVTVSKSGNVDTSKIGVYTITYTAKDSAGNVASKIRAVKVIASESTNHAPTVSNVSIDGEARVGTTLSLSYTFLDTDGDLEGASIVVWKIGDKELQRSISKSFTIPDGYEGKLLSAWVYPVDEHGLKGIAYAAKNNGLYIVEKTASKPLEQISFYAWDGVLKYNTAKEKIIPKDSPTLYLNPVDNKSNKSFESNVESAQAEGSKVWMLMSGNPDHNYLNMQIDKIVNYNATHGNKIVGMALDLEPWGGILNQNSSENIDMWKEYLSEITWIRNRLYEKGLKISVTIPFWLWTIDKAFPYGRPIDQEVVDIADEIVIMDYTTDIERFKSFVKPTLDYADTKENKRVKIAIELTEVNEENVSFYGHESDIENFVNIKFTQKSFSGFVLHALDAFAEHGISLELDSLNE